MSKNQMLIDATHPEETRVVVLRDGRVEEFDYESAARELLRGNIYLAKVTRVEPSLQAAFVDYGGNRHGFLAFNEIHPDYYQIPVADRQALLEEEAAEAVAAEADDDEADAKDTAEIEADANVEPTPIGGVVEFGAADDVLVQDSEGTNGEVPADDADNLETGPATPDAVPLQSAPDDAILAEDNPAEDVTGEAEDAVAGASDAEPDDAASDEDDDDAEPIDEVGSEDAMEEVPARPRRHRARPYKIQEVIKRRQIILVQVVKEERGNKGAALTTYLSLAGRYTVLMPNTGRGGGISRKITNPADRRRLKKIAGELDVPQGMGLIIRTAGAARNKMEIKRDYEYLLRLWENVRDLTLESSAPALVYAEGDLIKRSIRDLYGKEVNEVIVAGDASYRNAKDFMRMLMPSHARNVHKYEEAEPLFSKHQIERQLNAMFSPFVTLRSGGYLVINQTEALVAVDVNSGKATREFSIEETALNTNLEAAEEIARQFKLRDLAGLIVIDFIDMEENRNNRAVEKRLKDCLKTDRARIQVGRISHFGLLEMSRQRLRTGVLEGSTTQCAHCLGTGVIRSTESVALAVLRAIEDALMADGQTHLCATTSAEAALYILNNKRTFINEMEARYKVSIEVTASDAMHGPNFTIERQKMASETDRAPTQRAVNFESTLDQPDGEAPRKKPRRRRRRRSRDDQASNEQPREIRAEDSNRDDGTDRADGSAQAADRDAPQPRLDDVEEQTAASATVNGAEALAEDDKRGEQRHTARRSRRRGRRGGRRGRDAARGGDAAATQAPVSVQPQPVADDQLNGQPAIVQQNSPERELSTAPPTADQGATPAAAAPSMSATQPDADHPESISDNSKLASAAGSDAEQATSVAQPAYSFVPKGWAEVHGSAVTDDAGSAPSANDQVKPNEATATPAAAPSEPADEPSAPEEPAAVPAPSIAQAEQTPEPPPSPPRRGWWQRSK